MHPALRDKSELTADVMNCLQRLISVGVRFGGDSFAEPLRDAVITLWGQDVWDDCFAEIADLPDDEEITTAPTDWMGMSLDRQLRREVQDLVRLSKATVDEARDVLKKLASGNRQSVEVFVESRKAIPAGACGDISEKQASTIAKEVLK